MSLNSVMSGLKLSVCIKTVSSSARGLCVIVNVLVATSKWNCINDPNNLPMKESPKWVKHPWRQFIGRWTMWSFFFQWYQIKLDRATLAERSANEKVYSSRFEVQRNSSWFNVDIVFFHHFFFGKKWFNEISGSTKIILCARKRDPDGNLPFNCGRPKDRTKNFQINVEELKLDGTKKTENRNTGRN